MKKNNSKKITTQGVVIFSFIGLVLYALIVMAFGCLGTFILLKSNLFESLLKVMAVISSGVGLLVSTAFITVVGKMKGIVAAAIMGGGVFIIKLIGNLALSMGGYWNLNGLIGMFFIAAFALAGGLIGTAIKRG